MFLSLNINELGNIIEKLNFNDLLNLLKTNKKLTHTILTKHFSLVEDSLINTLIKEEKIPNHARIIDFMHSIISQIKKSIMLGKVKELDFLYKSFFQSHFIAIPQETHIVSPIFLLNQKENKEKIINFSTKTAFSTLEEAFVEYSKEYRKNYGTIIEINFNEKVIEIINQLNIENKNSYLFALVNNIYQVNQPVQSAKLEILREKIHYCFEKKLFSTESISKSNLCLKR